MTKERDGKTFRIMSPLFSYFLLFSSNDHCRKCIPWHKKGENNTIIKTTCENPHNNWHGFQNRVSSSFLFPSNLKRRSVPALYAVRQEKKKTRRQWAYSDSRKTKERATKLSESCLFPLLVSISYYSQATISADSVPNETRKEKNTKVMS